jgi:hypothetical protein
MLTAFPYPAALRVWCVVFPGSAQLLLRTSTKGCPSKDFRRAAVLRVLPANLVSAIVAEDISFADNVLSTQPNLIKRIFVLQCRPL